ncbi:MAG: hypothetical protein QM730_21710 [Anaerolineales bacterium]
MKREATTNSQANDAQPLYWIGGIAAVLMPVIIIIQMVAFISAPPPYDGTVADWFNIFQQNPLIGLIDFELLMVIYMLLSIAVSLALYMILKNINPYLAGLYMMITVIGVIAFITARPAFEMLQLKPGIRRSSHRSRTRHIPCSRGSETGRIQRHVFSCQLSTWIIGRSHYLAGDAADSKFQ